MLRCSEWNSTCIYEGSREIPALQLIGTYGIEFMYPFMVGRIDSFVIRVVKLPESSAERIAEPSGKVAGLLVSHEVKTIVPTVSLQQVIIQIVCGVEEIKHVSFVFYHIVQSLEIGVGRD